MDQPSFVLRSVLFVPANNARALERAKTLQVDALIFDLEDAVGPEQKTESLGQLKAVLEVGGFTAPVLAVRINIDDCAGIIESLTVFIQTNLIKAIVIPKVRKADDLTAIARLCPEGTPLWAMIETALGVVNLKEISAVAEIFPLQALILGPNDLRAELRVSPQADRAELNHIMSSVVLHARAHGLVALDGVYNAFRDEEGFARECRQGRILGFDGKTLIHPSQIVACEAAFAPSEVELDWAQRVVAAFALPENAKLGVVSMDGEMIERLHLSRAQALLHL
jgi:citrate lyase beta subunit